MKIIDLLTEAKKPTPPKTRSPAAASLADRKYQQKIIPNKKKKIDPKHKKTVGIDEQRSLANPRIVQVADDPQGIYDFAVVGPNHLSIRPFPAHQWNNLQSDARNHGYQLQYIGKDPAKAKAAEWPGETPKPRTMGMKEASKSAWEKKTNESTKQKGVDGKACWKGYKRMGTKKKGGKTVDNCVPTGK